MKINYLKDLINEGREIEFIYNNKKYSITYGKIDDVDVISFCEFYQDSIEVTNVDDLLNIVVDKKTILEIWKEMSEDEIWIF